MATDKGVKLDNEKIRLGLVLGGFAKGLWEVGCIGTFGANKYCDNGWQSVENSEKRYADALLRHLFAHLGGETFDPESGYRHLAHAAWNCLALLTLTHHKNFLKPHKVPSTMTALRKFKNAFCNFGISLKGDK